MTTTNHDNIGSASGDHIFLSYRSLERPFAARLAADLKNAGFKLWMDRFDIRPGEHWDRAIERAIDGCAALIAVLSPAYVASEICLNELARAHRAGRAIFPVLLQQLESDADWPILIQRRQYVDFGEWRKLESYQAPLDDLLRELHERFADQIGDPPDAESRYLNSLLADLEMTRGVLEYVPLEAVAERLAEESPIEEDEWAFDVLLDVQPGKKEEQTTRLYQVDAVLREHPSLVILGEAGTGKTTTLRWLARREALARKSEPKTHLLPVLVSLGQWRRDQTIEALLASSCSLLQEFEIPLAAGDLLLLFDGLNEMGSDGPEKARALRAWLKGLPATPHAVITCRPREYSKLELGDLPTAMLRELDEQQVRRFASKYLLSRASGFLDQVLPDPEDAGDARTAIGELARNPYMLSCFIYLYQSRPDEPLPGNTGVLFSKLAQALWVREARRKQRSGQPSPTRWDSAKAGLAGLARMMLESEEGDDLPVVSAIEILGSGALFQAALEASLIAQNGDFARFYHDLLRAYFAAEALSEADVETFDSWCRANTRHWQSVAVAWSGISGKADEYLRQLHWQDASELLSRGYAASEDAIRKPFGRALEELAIDHWRNFQPAMDALTLIGRPIVAFLAEELASKNADLRAKVAFVLGRIGDASAVDALVPLLDDPSADVQGRVATALLNIGGDSALSALSKRITDESKSLRSQAAEAIGKLGTLGAIDSLLPLLTDSEKNVRQAAIEALGRLGDRRALGSVLEHIRDEDDEIRRTTVEAIGRLGGKEAQAPMVEALRDPIEKVRLAAVTSLGAIRGPDATALLIGALGDESKDVRHRAAAMLGEVGDYQSVTPLLNALEDEDAGVRQQAARAIGRVGGSDVQDALVERLRGDDPTLWAPSAEVLDRQAWIPTKIADRVRWCVAQGRWTTCLELGDEDEVISTLRHVLKVGDHPHRRGAVETLRKLGWRPREPGAEFFEYYAARVDWDREVQLYPVDLLNLLWWLGPPEPSSTPVRKVVAEALGNLASPLCGEALERSIDGVPHGNEQSHNVQYLATVAAGVARCKTAVPALLRQLNPPGDKLPVRGGEVRIVTAQALGEIGGTLLDLLDHATREMPPGPLIFGNGSALAAIQSAARDSGIQILFERIPATALGRKRQDSDGFQISPWSMLGIQDESILEKFTVSAVIGEFGRRDRSKLPCYIPAVFPYNASSLDTALWELHTRMAVLTLLCLHALRQECINELATAALTKFWSLSAEPVLTEAQSWAGELIARAASAELERRRKNEAS